MTAYRFSFFFILVATVFFSCSKENVEQIVPLVTSASMTATVNDTAWTSITRVTKHETDLNMFIITGTSLSGQVIAVTIRGDEAGTYTASTSIDSLSAKVGCVWQPDATSPTTNYFVSKSGTATLTAVDTTEKIISGTFAFELTNTSLTATKSIEGGKFSQLKYSEH